MLFKCFIFILYFLRVASSRLHYTLSLKKMKTEDIHYLCFAGGGPRGLAYASALIEFQALLRYDYATHLKGACGSSIGALYATAVCAGYSPQTIQAINMSTHMIDLVNINFSNIMSHWAVSMLNHVQQWIENFLGNQRMTFGQFYRRFGKVLKVCASNLNTNQCEVFSHETTPDMEVAFGVAVSMCLPLVFPPQKINNHLYVDGGLTNNFPMNLFPQEHTVGMRVNWGYVADITGLETYFSRLSYVALSHIQRQRDHDLLDEQHRQHTIEIDCGNVSTVSWKMTNDTMSAIAVAGQNAVRDFVKQLDLKAIDPEARPAPPTRCSVGCQTTLEAVETRVEGE